MGFAQHAVKSLKVNRALLKKRKKYSELRKSYLKLSGDTHVAFKDISEFEKKRIRDKIIEQSYQDYLKELKIYGLSLLLTFAIIGILIWVILT